MTSSGIRTFNPAELAPPASNFAHGAATDQPMRWLHISGQVGIDENGNISNGFDAQLEQSFANVLAVVRADGMDVANIVKLLIYVVPPAPEVVTQYRTIRDRMMGEHTPACTYVGVTGLASAQLLVEVEAVAAAPI